MVTAASLTWKRGGDKSYEADCPYGKLYISRNARGSHWILGLQDRTLDDRWLFKTLKEAKANATLAIETLAEKQRIAAEKAHLAENRKRALHSRVYDPTAGVSWFDWAEAFVGCTADDVRQANAPRFCEGCGQYADDCECSCGIT